ncbi:hypothetical protein PR202_ga12470 [Eleusine coracana subsp. coracana]|uniref:Uncharacterized protein n=1 Tax=Eleusine coracana subsp. coracana TaxID=191504 RepID=A0AAV5CC59_ELECO|nr:hypothetical protein PR202_ga12470 [Eleusine coracana subsp. coracana]
MSKSGAMEKPKFTHALEVLVLLAALLHGAQCQQSSEGGSGGGGAANLTVVGTVFCDACSSSSFSNHSYFLPGVKVRLDCMIKVNSTSKEEIKITAEKVTNSYGAYHLDIPAIDGFECAAAGATAAESFCRAAVLDNPSRLCNVPAVTTTVGHISFPAHEACLYSLNSLYYRPGGKPGPAQCNAGPQLPPAALNTSLFYCPPWPWPPIPFCTPRPWFPPIPFFTPPPPEFHFPPIPFLTPPSPPPAGVPVPATAIPVLHAAVSPPAAGVPVPVPSLTPNLLDAISTAAAAARVPVPHAAAPAPASAAALAAVAVVVLAAAASSSTAAATTAIVSLAVPAVAVLPSWFFSAFSSAFDEAFTERSQHLAFFEKSTVK